jgi:aryl-alcohol dehydrogenase-like predicted oxidoreductase
MVGKFASMDYVTLGRTGIRASVMGLGCGGHSRLGLLSGKTEAEAASVVRVALDLGINLIDTAEIYKTETVVAKGVKGIPRDTFFLSTKAEARWEDRLSAGSEMRERVEGCLRRLETDYVDLFNLHAVTPDEYPYCCAELIPVLQAMQDEGKIRFLGITEQFIVDTSHRVLQMALRDSFWDVMMVGFNILNPSARQTVFPETIRQNVGTLGMFAVRRALSSPQALLELMDGLAARGLGGDFDGSNPLGFLEDPSVATNLQDAAYRFCRWAPGMNVVLSGTGNIEHLRANAMSLNRGPLPDPILRRLDEMFGKVDSVSGD